jgi:hypothetical protein
MTVETRTVKGLLGKKLGMTQGWDAGQQACSRSQLLRLARMSSLKSRI